MDAEVHSIAVNSEAFLQTMAHSRFVMVEAGKWKPAFRNPYLHAYMHTCIFIYAVGLPSPLWWFMDAEVHDSCELSSLVTACGTVAF